MPSTTSLPNVGLCVRSAELPASDLMQRIPAPPDVHWSVGDLMPSGRPRRRSLLRYEAPRTGTLSEMLGALLGRLEPDLASIRAAAEDPRIDVYLWVGIYLSRVN